MGVIEKIHNEFEFDLVEAIRETNESNFLQSVKPVTVPDKQFVDQVERYRLYYPGYNFITEKQIGDICLKYGLVIGSMLNFSGNIPTKNRLEIARFKLHDDDRYFKDPGLQNRILHKLMEETKWSISSERFGRGYVEVESGFNPTPDQRPFQIAPIGDSFVCIQTPEERVYQVFLKMNIYGSEWLIEFGKVGVGVHSSLWFQWSPGTRFGTSFSMPAFNVGYRFPAEDLSRLSEIDLSNTVVPMVVGPGTVFERYQGAVEVQDYRLRFRAGFSPVDSRMFQHLDDPIVLQPVPFGYLVVTKWGEESKITEFQSPTAN